MGDACERVAKCRAVERAIEQVGRDAAVDQRAGHLQILGVGNHAAARFRHQFACEFEGCSSITAHTDDDGRHRTGCEAARAATKGGEVGDPANADVMFCDLRDFSNHA
jgi:hypothetical protein